MSDDYTRNRFEWLDAICAQSSIDPAAFKLAYMISGMINRTTGDAWPGLDRMATSLGVNERTVRRHINALVNAGFLTKRRGGDGRTNRYRLAFPDRTPMADLTTNKSDINVQSVHILTGHSCHSDRTSDPIQTGHGCPPNPLKNSLKEISEKSISVKSAPKFVLDAEFQEFWKLFPRKVSKGQALKAFKTARAMTDLTTIMAGALRYGQARAGQDPRFTKHPATWLNGQCWDDENDSSLPFRVPLHQNGKDRTREALERLRAKDGIHG